MIVWFKQTYRKIQAEVDPLIVASLNDIDLCIDQLKVLFGVDVRFNDDNGSFHLEGNLMQIQCAQTYLDGLFEQRQVLVQSSTENSHRSREKIDIIVSDNVVVVSYYL